MPGFWPLEMVFFPEALFSATSFSLAASSAFRSRNELAPIPAAFALLVVDLGAIQASSRKVLPNLEAVPVMPARRKWRNIRDRSPAFYPFPSRSLSRPCYRSWSSSREDWNPLESPRLFYEPLACSLHRLVQGGARSRRIENPRAPAFGPTSSKPRSFLMDLVIPDVCCV